MKSPDTLITAADMINPLLTARDVMTPAPRTCSTFSTVLEAVMIFRDANCGFVPVLEDTRPIGVLTDRDVALALIDHEGRLPSIAVADIMSRGVATVSPDASLDRVIEAFDEKGGVRRLLVTDEDGHLLGVVSWSDLAPHVSDRGLGSLAKKDLCGA